MDAAAERDVTVQLAVEADGVGVVELALVCIRRAEHQDSRQVGALASICDPDRAQPVPRLVNPVRPGALRPALPV
jgi:hypothetical protein